MRALFFLMMVASCTPRSNPKPASNTNAEALKPIFSAPTFAGFGSYWFQGKAEIALYEVSQERYGELRPAQEVMVFVTEDFSADKQVKLDKPEAAGADRVPVLKVNRIRRFHTGIYDYSLMQSVFTPLDAGQHPFTLKTTTTVQDWCGHVFTQLNWTGKAYRTHTFSYFESEGDMEQDLAAPLLEDELWTRLRLSPESIPSGEVSIIPSAWFLRLRHVAAKAERAVLEHESFKEDKTEGLTLRYLNLPRRLSVRYESAFPHRILRWEEWQGDKTMSKGELRQTRLEPYWVEHDHAHDPLRDSLQLRF